MKRSKFKFCHSLAAWYQQLLSKFRSLHLWKENGISSMDNWETWNGCTVSDRNRWPIGHYRVVIEATCLLMLLTVHLKMALTILILDASKLEFDLHSYPNLKNLDPGERYDNTLQYSCLGNPMDRRAWWATVHGVAKSWTGLSDQTITTTFSVMKVPEPQ